MAISSADRKKASLDRKRATGVRERNITFTEDTYALLNELAKMSGYKNINSRNQNVIISKVLGQIVFETYISIDEEILNKNRQEGFFIAQQAFNLEKKGASYKDIAEYLKRYTVANFTNTDNEKWTRKTIQELIEGYYDLYNRDHAINSRG